MRQERLLEPRQESPEQEGMRKGQEGGNRVSKTENRKGA